MAASIADGTITQPTSIWITGNADLTTQAGTYGWPGDGSASNPIVISGLTLTASAYRKAVDIENTDLHLIIQNCTITNSGTTDNGFYLYESDNVVISNNTVNAAICVYYIFSDNAVIVNNNMTGQYGLFSDTVSDLVILNNNVSATTDGLDIYRSDGLLVSNNTVNAYGDALNLYQTSNASAANNTLISHYYGFRAIQSSNISVGTNSIGSYEYGVWVQDSDRITIDGNTVSVANSDGILVYYTGNVTISSNTVSANYNAIVVSGGYDFGNVTISNNAVTDVDYGIVLDAKDRSIIENNTIEAHQVGIQMGSSAYLNGNEMTDCAIWISMWNVIDVQDFIDSMEITPTNTINGLPVYFLKNADMDNSSVTSPSANEVVLLNVTDFGLKDLDLTYGGVIAVSCSNVTVDNAAISNAPDGVALYECNHCTISEGGFNGIFWEGIEVDYSGNITIAQTDLDAMGDGIYLYESDNAIIEDCVLSGNSQAIYLDYGSDNNTILRDRLTGSNGMCIYGAADSVIADSTVNGTGGTGIYLDVGSRNITISGNDVMGAEYGIYSYNAYDNVIANNTLNGTSQAGLYLDEDSYGNAIVGNDVSGNNDGIYVYCAYGNLIANNTLRGLTDAAIYLEDDCYENVIISNVATGQTFGIYTYYAHNNAIGFNTLTGIDQMGVYLDHGSNDSVSYNHVTGYEAGIGVYCGCDSVIAYNNVNSTDGAAILVDGGSYNLTIVRNTVTGYGGIDLYFDSDLITIANNTISNTGGDGIYAVESYHCTIAGNWIINSTGYGIFLTVCSGNEIYGNVLMLNHGAASEYDSANVQAYDDGTNDWNSTSFGNYWADWTTPDVDNNGIVDQAYSIDGGAGAEDKLPVTMSMNITSPASGNYTNAQAVHVAGTAIDGFGIESVTWFNEADGSDGSCAGTNEWSADIGLVPGENNIIVTVTDTMGKTMISNITVFYSSGAVVVMTPSNGSITYTANDTVDVLLHVTDAVSMTTANISHYVDGILVGSGSNNSFSGLTSFEGSMEMALLEGRNVFCITINDTAGNSVMRTFTVVRDTSAPSVSIDSPSDGTYLRTGSVTIVWSGSDELSGIAYYNVSVYDGAAWSNWSYLASGVTSKQLTGLADGSYTVYVEAVDNAGNANETMSAFVVDTEAPSISILSPEDGSINSTGSVEIQWTGSDASGIAYYNVSVYDGAAWSNWSYLASSVNEKLLDGLSDGTYTVQVEAVDNAGNTNATSVSFIVDMTDPSISITSPANGSYNNTGSVKVQWEGGDASGIAYYNVSVFDGTVWSNWSYLASGVTNEQLTGLVDGKTYTVYVKAVDNAGNANETSLAFTVDKTAPSVTITSPAGGSVIYGNATQIVWTASDASSIAKIEVSTDGVAWSTVTGSSYDLNDLANGAYMAYVRVTDSAGNVNTASVSFTVSVPGSAEGHLFDEDGNPLSGVTVTLGSQTAVTDAQGRFVFSNVTAGTYDLSIAKDGYRTYTSSITVETGRNTDVGTVTLVANDDGSSGDALPLVAIVAVIAVAAIIGAVLLIKRRKGP